MKNIYHSRPQAHFRVQVRSQVRVLPRCCRWEPEVVEDHRLCWQTWATEMKNMIVVGLGCTSGCNNIALERN